MLQRYRSYGMKDLSMMIVNSKLSHSRAEMLLLQDRVSFEVHQETEEEPVWDTLEGGKDDMYIYDRCGRLTFYIPFPLSIINDDTPLIHSALMASYFVSPCGITCDESSSSQSAGNTDLETTTPFPFTDMVRENENDTELSRENVHFFNTSAMNETFTNTDGNATDAYDYLNRTETFNLSLNESDYEDSNDTETSDFYNLIQRLFRNDIDYTTTEVYINNSSLPTEENATDYLTNSTNFKEQDIVINKTEKTPTNDILYQQLEASQEKDVTPKPKMKLPGRCAEADFEICKSWSKKKLLKAQRCCSDTMQGNYISEDVTCRNFGKRRCKKIRYLLKCCIKTNIMEVTEEKTTFDVKEETTMVEIEETTKEATTEETTIENNHMCCKVVDNEKRCHLHGQSGCEEDELLEKGTGQKK
ncbi:uncharacterized protein LOC129217653 isoform X2 [Uloborus diversus]|uniref:uncharacterized protein LOC129217653 isoform X2 n=1 Tax=Uloborus diversus TaxID=327109 RepID=UPI00240A044B|nr:uncharacterized protein LOC129217653 isoform X2 [Uloborus diversus]